MKTQVKKLVYNVSFLSFIIPVMVLFGVWIVKGIAPFGSGSLMIVDGLHQYMPFFSEYYEKLKHGDSLLYSWDTGMGNGFITLWAYYLASPLNLIILLFKKISLNTAVSLIVSLKIALSGYTFSKYLRYKREKGVFDVTIIGFSVAYAFSNFVIGYYWNIMWMDCIMILPIVVLGLEKLIKEDDGRLYVISLFYGLFCNYYIGFMLCVFLVMWYLLYDHKSVKSFFVQGIKFALCSVVAGAMGAIILIPAYLGISNTASAHIVLPEIKTMYGSFVKILETHMYLVEPITNQVDDSGTNLYCGIAPLLLLIIGLFSRKIPIKNKIKYVVVLAFFVVSFNNEFLNYLWHGCHNQYGIPNRFAFLYIFVILALGYEIVVMLKTIDKWYMLSAVIIFLSAIIYSKKASGVFDTKIYVLTAVLALVYFGLFFVFRLKKIRRPIFSYIFAITMLVEVIVNTYVGFNSTGVVDINNYFSDTEAIEKTTDYLAATDDGLYRVDMLNCLMLDEATWHNLKSVGIFGSTVRGDMVTAMSRMGFYTGANEYLYKGVTPLTNSLFGVKYVIGRTGDYNNIDVNQIDSIDGIEVFENPYPLPIAFRVNDLDTWSYVGSSPFDVQNSFCKVATGKGDIFTTINPEYSLSATNCSATMNVGSVSYERSNPTGCKIAVSFVLEEDSNLYANLRGNNIAKIRVYINDSQIAYDRFQIQAYHVGEYPKGTKVTLEYELNDNADGIGTLTLGLADFDWNAYYNVYESLNQNVMTVTDYDSGYVKGTIDCDQSGDVFTSIPYEEGWTVYVDGKEIKTKAIGEAFLGFDIDQGKHDIELKYFPKGMKLGGLVTIAGTIVYGLMWIWHLRSRRKKDGQKTD